LFGFERREGCYFWSGISYSGRWQKVFFKVLTPSFYSKNFDQKWWFWVYGRDLWGENENYSGSRLSIPAGSGIPCEWIREDVNEWSRWRRF